MTHTTSQANLLWSTSGPVIVACLVQPQVSGQAQYTGDVPLPPNALHAAFVTSARPHARLLSVDASAALALPGVIGYFDHTSVPGDNMIGPVRHDEEVFSSGVVTCVGAVIGVVVGETEAAARRGAAAVVIEYEELPAIISIEQAIAAGGWLVCLAADCFAAMLCLVWLFPLNA